jgi:hypothetical protein
VPRLRCQRACTENQGFPYRPKSYPDAPIDLLGFASGDPFANAGLFQSVEIRRWRKVIFNPPQD